MTLLSLITLEELINLRKRVSASIEYTSILLALSEAAISIYLVCLTIIWYIILISTSLYFHTLLENSVGMMFGVLFWYIVYTNQYLDSDKGEYQTIISVT